MGGLVERGRRVGGVLERGELAGLPEQDHLLQAAEEAGEAGHDEGVQCGGQPSPCLVRLRCGAQAGQLAGEGGGMN